MVTSRLEPHLNPRPPAELHKAAINDAIRQSERRISSIVFEPISIADKLKATGRELDYQQRLRDKAQPPTHQPDRTPARDPGHDLER